MGVGLGDGAGGGGVGVTGLVIVVVALVLVPRMLVLSAASTTAEPAAQVIAGDPAADVVSVILATSTTPLTAVVAPRAIVMLPPLAVLEASIEKAEVLVSIVAALKLAVG